MSHAALAFEGCPRHYKAVFAEPKPPKDASRSLEPRDHRDYRETRQHGIPWDNGLNQYAGKSIFNVPESFPYSRTYIGIKII